MHRLLNTLMMMVGLWVGLACGGDTDDRMVRRYAKCMTDSNTTLHRLTVSSALGTGNCSRLRGRKRFAVEIPCLVVPPQEAE